jgi:hypothetical protein
MARWPARPNTLPTRSSPDLRARNGSSAWDEIQFLRWLFASLRSVIDRTIVLENSSYQANKNHDVFPLRLSDDLRPEPLGTAEYDGPAYEHAFDRHSRVLVR